MNTDVQIHNRVDAVARLLATLPAVDLPVTNRWTPGLYAREIFMPAGSMVVSKIHRTEHPFVVLTGHAVVWDARHGIQHLKAGKVGITQPGTRRILYIKEDCRWITFHPTDKLDVAEIEAEIIEPHTLADGNDVDADIIKQLTEASV